MRRRYPFPSLSIPSCFCRKNINRVYTEFVFCTTARGQDHAARKSYPTFTSDFNLFRFRNKNSKFTKKHDIGHREMKTNENVISSPAEWLGVSCRARREKLEFTLQNIETELYILNQLDEFISELTNHVT